MIDKRFGSAAEAVSVIHDGAVVLISGFGSAGSPVELIHALVDAGVKDLTALAEADPNFKLQSGNLALAEAYEGLGEEDKAVRVYQSILSRTTVSQAYYGLGKLLARQGDSEQARAMMQEILDKQAGLPRYLRRQERPWVWKARGFLKTISAG